MSEFRIETDSIGEMQVPADRYWGAQTAALADEFPDRCARGCRPR
jgi:fumarate hydratase class II